MSNRWCLLALTLATTWGCAQSPGVPQHGQAVEIGSCAGGPPATLGASDERALLDEDERQSVLAEMRSRYPILERDGFAPPVILLWRKPAGEWHYMSLRPNGFPDNALCFTATFVAKVFRITPALTDKYFR